MTDQEYGIVEAASRPRDNTLLTKLIDAAERSVDMLFVTGKNTFDNQRDPIGRALVRGVEFRILLFKVDGMNADAMRMLLNTDLAQLTAFYNSSLNSIRHLGRESRKSSARSGLQLRSYPNLLAFDTLVVDRQIVWLHPLMPTYEPSFPSFVLRPPAGSLYLARMLGLYEELFRAGTDLTLA